MLGCWTHGSILRADSSTLWAHNSSVMIRWSDIMSCMRQRTGRINRLNVKRSRFWGYMIHTPTTTMYHLCHFVTLFTVTSGCRRRTPLTSPFFHIFIENFLLIGWFHCIVWRMLSGLWTGTSFIMHWTIVWKWRRWTISWAVHNRGFIVAHCQRSWGTG